jgi:hypothetical protein
MAQPVDANIVSTPSNTGQPYDACTDAAMGPWVKLPGGPVNQDSGQLDGQDFDSSGRWQQT